MAGSCPPVFDRAIGPAASASRSNCAVLRGETTFPQVARRVYAKCLDGGETVANKRIETALRNEP